jgi:alkylation response protein AidB-like acyl-CoA dehydrogenase
MPDSLERTQERLYHGIGLPEGMDDLRASVRRFAESEVAPYVPEMEEKAEAVTGFPSKVFRRMAEEGLFRLPHTAADGGAGLANPATAMAIVVEELAYYSASIAVVYVCQAVFSGGILGYATPALKEAYLPAMLSGEKIASAAITEPDAGSDVSAESVTTVAKPMPGGWALSGRKRFIIDAPVADLVCTLCTIDGALSMLVVDMKQDGVEVPPPDHKLGMHACLTSDIVFHDVFVPAGHLVGQAGKGLRIALGALVRGRIAAAATGLGVAQAAFDESVRWMRDRRLFGKKLADMQHWQYRIAERATQICMARDLCYKAALRQDAGELFPEPETSMAKLYGTQVAADMARDAVQLHGGYGYTSRLGADGSRYRVEQLYRDAKGPEIYEGSNEVMKMIVARQIFGR